MIDSLFKKDTGSGTSTFAAVSDNGFDYSKADKVVLTLGHDKEFQAVVINIQAKIDFAKIIKTFKCRYIKFELLAQLIKVSSEQLTTWILS